METNCFTRETARFDVLSNVELDADRRAMYLQLNRIPIAKEQGLKLFEKEINAKGLNHHTDTLTVCR